MNAITPFVFENTQVVRTTVDDRDDPWFVAADVCRILGIKNNRDAIADLDNDEKGVALTDTPGGQQEMAIISEGGLYTLILRSRKAVTPGTPQHRFRKWITGEVIPSIRKTGGYSTATNSVERAAHKHALALIERLKRETNPAIRGMIHAMLDQTTSAVGLPTPPLDAIGRDAPPPPDILGPFWRAVADLEAHGVAVNHARDPHRLAINLREVCAAAGLTRAPSLHGALRLCRSPRFLAHSAVHSVITGGTVKCWIFERNPEDAA